MKTIYQAKLNSAPCQPYRSRQRAIGAIALSALCWILFPAVIFAQTYQIERGKSQVFTETTSCFGARQYRIQVTLPSYLTFINLGTTIDFFDNITMRFAIAVSSAAPLGSASVNIRYEFGDLGIVFCTSSFSYNIVVTAPPAPNADFTAAPTFGLTPLTVRFTDKSSGGSVTSRLWNFGNGQTSALTSPSHTYQTTGQFTVSLTLNGPGGSDTETKANYITATRFPPDIIFSPDSVRVTVGQNDSTKQTVVIGNTGTGELYFTISAPGTTVATQSASKQLQIDFGSSQTGEKQVDEAEWKTLVKTNLADLGASYANAQLSVNQTNARMASASITWLTFSPASGMLNPNGSQNIALTFRTAGLVADTTYRANLLIASNDPDETQVTIPVRLTVLPGPKPRALFSVSPASGFIGTSFNLDASNSRDGQTPKALLQVRWDFENDGVWDTPYSTTKTASHQYLSPETKTVKLEVKDADGNIDLRMRTVTVSDRAPASFSLLSPANGDTVKVVTPAFKWKTSLDPDLADTVRYQIFISTSSFFSSALTDTFSAGKDTTITLPVALKQRTRYYWKVQAADRWGQSTFSAQSWSFMAPDFAPRTPTFVSPANGAVNQPTILPVSWSASAGAITYRLQIATTIAFTATAFDDSTITTPSQQIGPLKINTTYYARVNAKNTNGTSAWSSPVWRFTTVALPGPVSLVSPLHAAMIGADSVRFIWRKSQSAVSRYWFELAADSLLTNPVIDSTLSANDTTKVVRRFLTNQSYWWRVKAKNTTGWGLFSEKRRFSILRTGVASDNDVPLEFSLSQNYPNPFNPSTSINYTLPKSAQVELRIYDLKGREIQVLVNGRNEAGKYTVDFNAADLQSGVYFYRLRAGNFVQTRKMIVVK